MLFTTWLLTLAISIIAISLFLFAMAVTVTSPNCCSSASISTLRSLAVAVAMFSSAVLYPIYLIIRCMFLVVIPLIANLPSMSVVVPLSPAITVAPMSGSWLALSTTIPLMSAACAHIVAISANVSIAINLFTLFLVIIITFCLRLQSYGYYVTALQQ